MKCGCILRTILMKSCHGGGGVSGVNGSGERRKKRFKYDNFPRSFFLFHFVTRQFVDLSERGWGGVMWGLAVERKYWRLMEFELSPP